MTFTLTPDVSMTDVGNGMVLLDERGGRYFQLNETGAVVLRRILAGVAVDEVVAELCAQHPGAAGRVAADVSGIIDSLCAAKVVVR
ncbi:MULTISPECIES: lasso peptide biosynthesis PqqD family chaperone [Actinoalloteichus]|uniref:Coenzyme PQQ synthesis protein D (PqqD) n=1 Tax=Actinoalloteichus fjordicus TaxID=1612552 RepID=A0A1V0D993_9PSEU|nr:MULTISPECIES: lasso peptide biosynthesis PqqD family chaperone [Actinoalloteichus]APU13607.1 Coenzyme PQQ synthesis protein D (PqqD) [Actinoalloteichus fjordicus]APU19554.1 Coenzyme PQQ synthesis protein D (PqqD) [Actinoalloteichus sp. GBA129-24]ARA91554.1 PqqD-like protein B1 [Actinoalloteichus fjordicus]